MSQYNKTILKAGALLFDDKQRLLAVHKMGKPRNELIVPGGKIETGESIEAALQRELQEELCVELVSWQHYATFQAKAIYEDALLIMHTYFVEISGVPIANQEIDAFVWLDKHFDQSEYRFASILGQQLLPKLRQEGKLG